MWAFLKERAGKTPAGTWETVSSPCSITDIKVHLDTAQISIEISQERSAAVSKVRGGT